MDSESYNQSKYKVGDFILAHKQDIYSRYYINASDKGVRLIRGIIIEVNPSQQYNEIDREWFHTYLYAIYTQGNGTTIYAYEHDIIEISSSVG
jgi:hypothetical protein